MASFQTHMSVGFGTSCSLGTYVALQNGAGARSVALTNAFGMLGSLLPDVDSDTVKLAGQAG